MDVPWNEVTLQLPEPLVRDVEAEAERLQIDVGMLVALIVSRWQNREHE